MGRYKVVLERALPTGASKIWAADQGGKQKWLSKLS